MRTVQMTDRSRAIKRFVLDIVFPNKCPVCRRAIRWDKLICNDCLEKLPVLESAEQCIFCGKLHPEGEPCQSKNSYDNAVSVMKYKGNAKRAIYNFKNRYALNLAEFSAPYIYKALEENDLLKTADCVTYVPMYKKKEFRRGYNQALELARYVSYSTGVPLVREMLVHKKTQTSQHNLSADERKLAAKSTYSLNPKSKWDKGFKTVILVDDVLTTGSTLNACADILKQAGFERVICASICVTPLQKENEDIKAAQ